jgi:hypothetical protein
MPVVSPHDDIYVVIGECDRECDVKVYQTLRDAENAVHDMIHGLGPKRVRVYRVVPDLEDDPEWLFGQQLNEQIDWLDFDAVPTAA